MISALLEFAFVVLLNRVPGGDKNKIQDCTPGERKLSKDVELRGPKITDTFNGMEKDKAQKRKGMEVMTRTPPIHLVDMLSFCFYIFFFISFNAIYWVHYQM